MVLTTTKSYPKTGFSGYDLKQIYSCAETVKTPLNIQSQVSSSGTRGLNIQNRLTNVANVVKYFSHWFSKVRMAINKFNNPSPQLQNAVNKFYYPFPQLRNTINKFNNPLPQLRNAILIIFYWHPQTGKAYVKNLNLITNQMIVLENINP
jgi:hypothetical protein